MAEVKPKKPTKAQSRELGAAAGAMTDAQADVLIAEFGAAQRALETLEAAMNVELNVVKAQFETRAKEQLEIVSNRYVRLYIWALKHRRRLTDEGKIKTARLPSGELAWRDKPASVQIEKGVNEADVLAQIEVMLAKKGGEAFSAFVRIKSELNKEAMLDDQDLAEQLDGVTIRSAGETFKVEPFGAQLAGTE